MGRYLIGFVVALCLADLLFQFAYRRYSGRWTGRNYIGGGFVAALLCMTLAVEMAVRLRKIEQLLVAYDATGKSNSTLDLLGRVLMLCDLHATAKQKKETENPNAE